MRKLLLGEAVPHGEWEAEELVPAIIASLIKQINYENPRRAVGRGAVGADFFVFKEKASKREPKVMRLH